MPGGSQPVTRNSSLIRFRVVVLPLSLPHVGVRCFRSDVCAASTRIFFLDTHGRQQDAKSEFLPKKGSEKSENSDLPLLRMDNALGIVYAQERGGNLRFS